MQSRDASRYGQHDDSSPVSRVHGATKRTLTGSAVAQHGPLARRLRRVTAELAAARAELLGAESLHRSMFNSTRTNTALLDESGKIVDVNEGWHAFADANGFVGSAHGLGSSYLDICARAVSSPHDAVDAVSVDEARHAVADVLAGRSESATLLEACHSPVAQR